jgi:hypothetical protein
MDLKKAPCMLGVYQCGDGGVRRGGIGNAIKVLNFLYSWMSELPLKQALYEHNRKKQVLPFQRY